MSKSQARIFRVLTPNEEVRVAADYISAGEGGTLIFWEFGANPRMPNRAAAILAAGAWISCAEEKLK